MENIKLHLGCGWRNFGKEWIHIDGGDYEHLDYKDITNLPFKDNEVDLIYSSHVISYFDRDEIIPLLKEWNRVLKPGGKIRLAVPDFSQLVKVYEKTGDLRYILGPVYGKMKMGNKIIYHKTTYDFVSLANLLIQSGFEDIDYWDWKNTEHTQFDDHSQAYMLPDRDKEKGILISLNIEGIKSWN